jgi:MmyB-like transcription regulator ligand binding domain
VLWLFFTADPARYLIVNWLDEASQLVGQLRAHLAQYPGDPRGPEIVASLTAASPKFAELCDPASRPGYRGQAPPAELSSPLAR